jgi:hypothetical protein
VNHFAVANASLGNAIPNPCTQNSIGLLGIQIPTPKTGLCVGVANSWGSIVRSDGPTGTPDPAGPCHTSQGKSIAADVSAAGTVVASLLTAESDVTACNDGTNTIKTSGGVLGLGGAGVDLPGLLGGPPPGSCSGTNGTNGDPNVDTGIPGLLPIICNAEDTSQGSSRSGVAIASGNQTTIPYAVREALNLCLLDAASAPPPLGQGPAASCTGTFLAKVTGSASEAAAAAPGTTGATTSPTTGPTTGATTSPTTGPTTGVTTSPPSGQTTSTTAPPTGETTGVTPPGEEVSQVVPAKAVSQLPFTGYDAVTAALIGLVILGSGVLLLEYVRRRSGTS